MPLPQRGTSALFSNSFLIFLSRFFPSLASLLVILWYARQLPVSVYGTYSNFWIQVNVFYPLVCFGIHVLVITYSKELLVQLAGKLKPLYYIIYAGWVLLLSAVFALVQSRIGGIGFTLPFLFILSYSLAFILESLLIVFRNYGILISVNVAYAAAYIAIHWKVLGSGYNLAGICYLLLLVNTLKVLVYSAVTFININSTVIQQSENQLVSISSIRTLWLHLGAYDIVQTMATWIDKFLVALVLSTTASAVYFNGSMNIPFLPIILSAAGSAVLIQLAAGTKADEQTAAVRLMNQSGKMLSCIVFPLFFFLLLFSQELIVTLFPKYLNAYPIFILALLVLPLRAYSFTTVLQRMHKGNIINAGAIGDIVLAVLLMYPLYKWLGLPGVALSYVISSYLQAAFYLLYSARALRVGVLQLLPFGNWLVKLIVFGFLFIGIHYITNLYFTGKIVLFLGGGAMGTTVILSLWVELKYKRNNNHGDNKQSEI